MYWCFCHLATSPRRTAVASLSVRGEPYVADPPIDAAAHIDAAAADNEASAVEVEMKPPEAAPPAVAATVAPLFLALSAEPTHPLSLASFESALVSSLLELGCERAPAVAPRVSRRLALASKPALTRTLKNQCPKVYPARARSRPWPHFKPRLHSPSARD